MKKIFSIILAVIILFNANALTAYADATDTTDYLTAEKMADNEYMAALLNELLYVDVEETTNNKYEIKNNVVC